MSQPVIQNLPLLRTNARAWVLTDRPARGRRRAWGRGRDRRFLSGSRLNWCRRPGRNGHGLMTRSR